MLRRFRRWLRRLARREGLYARIEGRAVLDHEARRSILKFVQGHPCCTFAEIQRAAGLAHGTTKWHLDKLVRARIIKRLPDGRAVRYMPVEMGRHEVVSRVALRDPTRASIARIVLKRPGITQHDLTTRLGLAQSTVHHHCQRLLQEQLLVAEREGREVRYGPGPDLQRDLLA